MQCAEIYWINHQIHIPGPNHNDCLRIDFETDSFSDPEGIDIKEKL